MYRDGRLLRQQKKKARGIVALARCWHLLSAPSSSAGRDALLALHPLLEGGLRVADRAAQLDVGRAIAGEAALGQPGHAEVQVAAPPASGSARSAPRPADRAPANRSGWKFLESIWRSSHLVEARACYPRNCRISSATDLPTRGTLRVGHIDKTTSDRGWVLSMRLLEACFASLQTFAASLVALANASADREMFQAPVRRREASHPVHPKSRSLLKVGSTPAISAISSRSAVNSSCHSNCGRPSLPTLVFSSVRQPDRREPPSRRQFAAKQSMILLVASNRSSDPIRARLSIQTQTEFLWLYEFPSHGHAVVWRQHPAPCSSA